MELSTFQKTRLFVRNWRGALRMVAGKYDVPLFNEDMGQFWHDPYPAMKRLRAEAPVAMIPLLETRVVSRYADVAEYLGRFEVLSHEIPNDGMIDVMGHSMIRKDGDAHRIERRAIMPTIAPKTAKTHWVEKFDAMVDAVLDDIVPLGRADFLSDISMQICGEALGLITGLTNMPWQEIDRTSQGMIDAVASMGLDSKVLKNSRDCTRSIDQHVDQIIPVLSTTPDASLISSQIKAGLSNAQIKSNVKLAISGGQNEPRDALAGSVFALLKHPEQLAKVQAGEADWHSVFDEYIRWISPIGAAPRLVTEPFELHGSQFEPGDSVLFLISSAHRDERVYENPDEFDVTRKGQKHFAFGKGPHFCAGAHPSRALIADVALPKIFERMKNLRLAGDVPFGGWTFRGPLKMPVTWTPA